MRAIRKGSEPPELSRYRAAGNTEYDGPNFTPVKGAIRMALLKEQGWLCAYCMTRIIDKDVKVEHWHCRSNKVYKGEQIDYGNMLGVCTGNRGGSKKEQHCDERKGDGDIKFNPANPAHHPRLAISYSINGEICSDDADFNRDLNERLNLNHAKLKNNRRAVSDEVIKCLNKSAGCRTRAEVDRMVHGWKTPDGSGRLQEYCDVAVFFLEKRRKRL